MKAEQVFIIPTLQFLGEYRIAHVKVFDTEGNKIDEFDVDSIEISSSDLIRMDFESGPDRGIVIWSDKHFLLNVQVFDNHVLRIDI